MRRSALTDLREVLGVLCSAEARLTPQPTLADLDRLLAASQALGIAVTRRDEGQPRPVPHNVQRAAYSVVQEALTNVHKHAGDATEVVLRYLPDTRIAAEPNAPKVVMLTTVDLDEHVHAALRAGAVGFLLKDTPPRDLAAAVCTVTDGNAMLAPTVTKRLIQTFVDRQPAALAAARESLAALSDREQDVARAVAHGLSNNDIGHELGMSEATVKRTSAEC